MTGSAFRRNVAEHLGIATANDIKTKAHIPTPDDSRAVRDFIEGCRVAWRTTKTKEAAVKLEWDIKRVDAAAHEDVTGIAAARAPEARPAGGVLVARPFELKPDVRIVTHSYGRHAGPPNPRLLHRSHTSEASGAQPSQTAGAFPRDDRTLTVSPRWLRGAAGCAFRSGSLGRRGSGLGRCQPRPLRRRAAPPRKIGAGRRG